MSYPYYHLFYFFLITAELSGWGIRRFRRGSQSAEANGYMFYFSINIRNGNMGRDNRDMIINTPNIRVINVIVLSVITVFFCKYKSLIKNFFKSRYSNVNWD